MGSTMKVNGKEVIIIGAGWQGGELYSYVRDLVVQGEKIHLVGFIDEKKPPGLWEGMEILGGFNVLEDFLHLHQNSIFHYITATGDNQLRQQFVQKIEHLNAGNLIPWTLRHLSAIVGHDNKIGAGTCLAPGSIITTRSQVGKHSIVNVLASISHDCVLGDFANINPGAIVCGNVRLGEGCYIGAGATIIDKVSIGNWTVIGAGAVVIQDLPANVTAVGVPARIIKKSP